MNFKQLIRNKGGWIGAIALPFLVNFYTTSNCDRGLCDGPGMLFFMVMAIPVGFLIGSFIYNKFWRGR